MKRNILFAFIPFKSTYKGLLITLIPCLFLIVYKIKILPKLLSGAFSESKKLKAFFTTIYAKNIFRHL